jgi:hypothetical protein
MPTHGNAPAGCLAASLAAIELAKLLAGERGDVAAGREVLLDARSHALVASKLVRNASCRFTHERWSIERTPDVTLRAALALDGGKGAEAQLCVADSAFVSKLVCEACDCAEEIWRLRESVDERLRRCPRCRALRELRGFDLVERISADRVPAALLDRPLSERGLRAGEVFGVEGGADGPRYFGLGLDALAPAPGATVVVAGLGNIGSYLAPLVARMPSVSHVILCDPDVYEPHQVAGQDIEASFGGRAKAEVQAERLRRIRPTLGIEVFVAPVEQLPLGRLLGAITVSCLDSRAARLRLAARAWRAGSPFVDAAVGGGPSLTVRTTVYLPEADAACFECAFDANDYATLEQVQPCAAAA